jgi:hypothetical protein
MKILNDLQNLVSDVNGYKQQFVVNEKKNILVIDPVMSRYDYYNVILPLLSLHGHEEINLAFTSISKFTDSPKEKPIILTEFEISWSNVIVFPFSVNDYLNENGVHLFDEIKSINEDVKIVFMCETVFTHQKFKKSIIDSFNRISQKKIDEETERKINDQVQLNILNQLNKSDCIVCNNNFIYDLLKKTNQDYDVRTILPKNYSETIREGLDPSNFEENELLEFLDPKEIKVLIHCLNLGKSMNSFLKNVVAKAPDNVVFYSQTYFKGVNQIGKCSITHWYKILFKHSFDYVIFVGDYNNYDVSSQYVDGIVLDALFMRSIPVFLNKKNTENLSVSTYEIMNEATFLEKLNGDFQERFDLNLAYMDYIEKNSVNEEAIEMYKNVFLKFE